MGMTGTHNGFFLTIEGGEGVGKTTLLQSLRTLAEGADVEVVFTREPGGTRRAELLRNVLLDTDEASFHMSAMTEALIINAARSDHVENLIRPALARGALVISDRFSDSTRAYQGRTLNETDLEDLIRIATQGLEPDLTLVLDGDPVTLIERRERRGGPQDRFESRELDFHIGVREAFLAVARAFPDRIVVVDAERPADAVLDAVLSEISRKYDLTPLLQATLK